MAQRNDDSRPRRNAGHNDSSWIFPEDPGTFPTEKLPEPSELQALAEALPPGDAERGPLTPRPERPVTPSPLGVRTRESMAMFEPSTELPRGHEASGGRPTQEDLDRLAYARSGTTPNAPEGGQRIELPQRFHDLNIFDALRDILALICLMSGATTAFTASGVHWLELTGMITGVIAIIGILTAQGLRWGLRVPRTSMTRTVRVGSQIPAILAAVTAIVVDLVTAIPVMFQPLPEGPPVGVGVGVSLLLVGALVGIEPRAHCGYLPMHVARRRARGVLMGLAVAAGVSLLIALVMVVGRLVTTGWAFSLMTLANTLVSAVILVIFFGSAFIRDRTWFVTSMAMVAALLIAAVADNTLELEFAVPLSFATGYVYLPFLFAGFGVAVSRSFIRTMPVSFQRVDWLVYATRAFELSVVLHIVSVLWNVLTALAAFGGVGRGPWIHLVQAFFAALFAATSYYARRNLLERPAEPARAAAVVAALFMVVFGFLMVIVGSLGTLTAAGLGNGGVALSLGITTALMLTVPSPVRDEFGAPDLVRMFEDFRRRDALHSSLLSRVPDVSAQRAQRKEFPGEGLAIATKGVPTTEFSLPDTTPCAESSSFPESPADSARPTV